jgi:hypothetical protein
MRMTDKMTPAPIVPTTKAIQNVMTVSRIGINRRCVDSQGLILALTNL